MMADISHLEGISASFVSTGRLRTRLLTAGNPDNDPILFLHGNASSSTIWEELMLRLSDDYYCLAPDLRGFGKADDDKIIDARRGMGDWVDDIAALAGELGLESYHLVGHSLGGFVCWGVLASNASQLRTATLIAPGPPMGFGGVSGEEGAPNNPDYSGSGGGIVVEEFARRIREGDRSTDDPLYSPRNTMNRLFWKNGYRADREEDFLTALLQIHTGEKRYPGDYMQSEYWPGVAPGRYGPVNALSPKYNRDILQKLWQSDLKPPLLWIQGEDDQIISDTSFSDPGYQGKMELRQGWPGEEIFPPQPMVSQIRYALRGYERRGGKVRREIVADCGHTPFVEQADRVESLLRNHFLKREDGL